MAKLILGDGVKIRTTDRLKDYWDLPKILSYYKDGTLLDWLMYDCGAEAEFTEPVKALEMVTDTKELAKRLCEIFGMPFDEAAFVDLEEVNKLKEREARLRKITANDEVLDNIGKVAFDQKEMNELIDKGEKIIYLVNNTFYIDLDEENIAYKGVGETTAVIRSEKVVDFKALGIDFKDIAFDEKYAEIEKDSQKAETEQIAKDSCSISSFEEQYAKLNRASQNAETEQITKDNRGTSSELVEKMRLIVERCWANKHGDIGVDLYINRPGGMPKNKLEELVVPASVAFPEDSFEMRDIVALIIPQDGQIDKRILLTVKGVYFPQRFPMFGGVMYSESTGYLQMERLLWTDVIYAISNYDLISKQKKENPMLEGMFNNIGAEHLLAHGIKIKTNNEIKNYDYNKDFTTFLVDMVNKIKRVDDLVSFNETNYILEEMGKIVEKYKNNVNVRWNGGFYVRKNMPRRRLESVLNNFTERLVKEKLNGQPIRVQDVVALYQDNNTEFSGKNSVLCSLLITGEGVYYSTYDNKEKFFNNFIHWNKMTQNVTTYVNQKKSRVEMTFSYFDGINSLIPSIYLNLKESENTVRNFLVPMLNELKNVDIMI